MASKQFGKGFAQKHFAEKHFAEIAEGGELTVTCEAVVRTRTTPQAAVTRGTEVVALLALRIRTAPQAVVRKGREIVCDPVIRTRTAPAAQALVGGLFVGADSALRARLVPAATVTKGRVVVCQPMQRVRTAPDAAVDRGAIASLAYVVGLAGTVPSDGIERLELQSFAVLAGTYISLRVSVSNSAGEPVDLEGSAARLFLARPRGEPVLDLAGAIDESTVTFDLPDEQNEELRGTYRWEIWLKDTADHDVPVAHGYATFRESARLAAA